MGSDRGIDSVEVVGQGRRRGRRGRSRDRANGPLDTVKRWLRASANTCG